MCFLICLALPCGDDGQGFDTRWHKVLLSIQQVPSDDILEKMCKMHIRGSDQFKTVLSFYEQEIEQHNFQLNYQNLKTMV